MVASVSCQSPLAPIREDIKQFKSNGRLVDYRGVHRAMRVAEAGDAKLPPVIFVHGSPGSWEGWAHFLVQDDLRKRYHLLAVDRPGYGGSGGGKVEVSIQKQAADIIDVLQLNQSGRPAILVGHSLGGAVIARMAMDFPDKVSGLLFLASSVDPDLESIYWYQHVARVPVVSWMIPDMWRVCNEELFPFQQELEQMRPLWPQIKARAVIMQGDLDDLVPAANLKFLVKNLNPGLVIEAREIVGMNHFLLWSKPELVLEGLRALE